MEECNGKFRVKCVKATAVKILKTLLAGIVAFLILSVFAFFYYNIPVGEESLTFSTNRVSAKNDFFIRCTEGFSYGKTDANGFNNKKALEDINILLMGSSHMEAYNVGPDENVTYKLNELLKENNMCAYNIGASGHKIYDCVNNLENAVEEFSPSDYIVIEFQQTRLDKDKMEKTLKENLKRKGATDNKVMDFLQRFDYLRLIYSQYKSYVGAEAEPFTDSENEEYKKNLDLFMKTASEKAGRCKLILLLNNQVDIDEYGEVKEREAGKDVELLREACENNGITLVDMHDDFVEFYKENKILARGFSNSRVGVGHLNKYGHKVIAQTLYDEIVRLGGIK